jgi:TRAP-type C4-dicarboxylate transport system permease small subunit
MEDMLLKTEVYNDCPQRQFVSLALCAFCLFLFYFIIFGGGGWALMLSDQTDDTNDHNMKVSGSILAHE